MNGFAYYPAGKLTRRQCLGHRPKQLNQTLRGCGGPGIHVPLQRARCSQCTAQVQTHSPTGTCAGAASSPPVTPASPWHFPPSLSLLPLARLLIHSPTRFCSFRAQPPPAAPHLPHTCPVSDTLHLPLSLRHCGHPAFAATLENFHVAMFLAAFACRFVSCRSSFRTSKPWGFAFSAKSFYYQQ